MVGWVTVPYLVSGLIAWWRRPVSRLGPLMLAAGFVTPLPCCRSPTTRSGSRWELFEVLPAAMYLHVFLAYPSGRLRGTPERLTVVSCYVATLLLTVVKIMVGVQPTNIFTLTVRPVAALRVEQVQFGIICALLLCGAVLLYLRRSSPGRSKRRFAALLVDSFGFALV